MVVALRMREVLISPEESLEAPVSELVLDWDQGQEREWELALALGQDLVMVGG